MGRLGLLAMPTFGLALAQACTFIISVSFVLITANGFIAIMFLLFGVFLPSIIQTEEQTLLEKFGDEYREYTQRAGRFLPRRGAKGKGTISFTQGISPNTIFALPCLYINGWIIVTM